MITSKLVSLDLGSKNIHIVEGRNCGDHIEVGKMINLPIPPNSLTDGKLENSTSLINTIHDTLSKNGIKAKQAVLTVQSSAVIMREFILPAAESSQMKGMVINEMEQYLPSTASEYLIEFRVEEKFEQNGVKRARIKAAAMPADMAQRHFALLKALGFKPVALDINQNSLSKLLKPGVKMNGESCGLDVTAAIIDLGFRNTCVNVVSKGRMEFSRVVMLGGRDLDSAIANRLGISIIEAENKKLNELRLDREEGMDGDSINSVGRMALNQLTGELQKIFQYYSSRGIGIQRIYIHGGGANIKGIDTYLGRLFNVPAAKLRTLGSVKYSDEYTGRNTESGMEYFVNAAGSLIRY